jgi:hypothetical protein
MIRIPFTGRLLALVALAGGCGPAPVLPYPPGTFTAVEIDEVADRDGDRPVGLPRVTDAARIEALVRALNAHARPMTAPRRPIVATLHLARRDRPALDIGLLAPRPDASMLDLYLEGAYHELPPDGVLPALADLGLDVSRWRPSPG